METSFWDAARTVLAVIAPLVAIPLTVTTFYLRSLREHQITWHGELVRRFEGLENSTAQLRQTVGHFERDYTTKEEWLRECMMARRTLENLSKTAVKLETSMDSIMSSVQPFLVAGGRLLQEQQERATPQPDRTGSES